MNLLRLKNAQPLELKSAYAAQGLLDYLFGRRNDSGFDVTAVVGASCHRSDWLPLLVDCVPQRLVLILDSLPGRSETWYLSGDDLVFRPL